MLIYNVVFTKIFIPKRRLEMQDNGCIYFEQAHNFHETELDLDKTGFDVIDEGIRKLVKVLWKLKFKTVCSCSGNLDRYEYYPWVTIWFDVYQESRRMQELMDVLARFNSEVDNMHFPLAKKTWCLMPIRVNGKFCLYLKPYNSNPTRSKKVLKNLRKSSDELAKFIENRL